MDGRRRQWLASDVHYYGGPLGVSLREQFGVMGLTVFDAFLRTCKRNAVPGEITYSSDADFLAQIGLAGLVLTDERGQAWTLDDLWTFLGRTKNTRRTRRGPLTNVRSTRWERWENSRSKGRNTDPLPTRSERDVAPDKDNYNDSDNDNDGTTVAVPEDVWLLYAQRCLEAMPEGSIHRPQSWLEATRRNAKQELAQRAADLLFCYDLTHTELVDVLRSDTAPGWLAGCRRKAE